MGDAHRSRAATQFGARVRARRTALGWSQMRLAEEVGLHFTYISSVERGKRNISLENIVRLAAALSVDPGDLIAGLSAEPAARPHRSGPG